MRARRERMRLTTGDLARLARTSDQTIRSIEAGDYEPRAGLLARIADALGYERIHSLLVRA